MRIIYFGALLVFCFNPASYGQTTTCFGGKFVYEKVSGVTLGGVSSTPLTQRKDAAITSECRAQCQSSSSCLAFFIDYKTASCSAFKRNSNGRRDLLNPKLGGNYFEKICLFGVTNYDKICGQERIWSAERVLDAYLDGFDNKTVRNSNSRTDCFKLCLTETEFSCRSADYNGRTNECYLSREDRRSKPQAFVVRPGSGIDYLENQCAGTLPDCRYETQNNLMISTMDDLMFAANQVDCENLCDNAKTFTCRSYTYDPVENRCYLSGDDTISGATFPTKQGVVSGERQCTVSQCELARGTVIYEKISGHILRSGVETVLGTSSTKKGITEQCSKLCREQGAACPSFAIDYGNNICYQLDRNSQGRSTEITSAPGRNYFEKTCVRVPLVASCTRKAWQFERTQGKDLKLKPDRLVPRVASRRDCIENCLLETSFLCRSVVYDTTTLDCRLSRFDRRSAPNNFGKADASMEYLENQCPPVDASCRFEQTQDSYPKYLDATIVGISNTEQCAFSCNNYIGFNCRSFSFNPSSSECLLSGDDKASVGAPDAVNSRQGTLYNERVCSANNPSIGFPNPGGNQYPIIGVGLPGVGNTGFTGSSGGSRPNNINFDLGFGPTGPSPGFGGNRIPGRNPIGFPPDRTPQNGIGPGFDVGFPGVNPNRPGININTIKPGIVPNRPGIGINPNRPGIGINPNRPGIGIYPNRPGTGINPNHPGFGINPNLPGTGINPNRPGIGINPSRPGIGINPNRPGYGINANQPGIGINSNLPGFGTNSNRPAFGGGVNILGTGIGSNRPGIGFDFNRPGTGFGSNHPGTGFGPSQPGTGFGPNQPGFGIVQNQPGTGISQNRPGFSINSKWPGFGFTPQRPGSGFNSFNPGTGNFNPNRPSFGGGVNNNVIPGRPGINTFNLGGANRCRTGQRVYEKVSGFELSRVKSFPLFSTRKPGITRDCLMRCNEDAGCQAFNLDHNRYECLGLERGASTQPSDLRLYAGVDHFEAVCLTSTTCNSLWIYERIPDYAMMVQEQQRFTDITKEQCMDRCLSETTFQCRSANYDYRTRSCFLFAQDRHSQPTGFKSTPDIDYLENQCASQPSDCNYGNRERDKFLVYATKTQTVFSEFDCERACNIEREFKCWSYSFLSVSGTRTDQCLLSASTGTDAGINAFSFQRGAIFGEKQCRTFSPGPIGGSFGGRPLQPGGGFGGVNTFSIPGRPTGSGGFGGSGGASFPSAGRDVASCPYPLTYDKILGVDFRGAERQEIKPRQSYGITIDCLQVCSRERTCVALTMETPRSSPQRCFALDRAIDASTNGLTPAPEVTYFEKVCIPETSCGKAWAFVRVPGFDLEIQGRVLTNILSRQDCQAVCLRASDLPCRSAVYHRRQGTCKLLAETRRTDKDKFKFVSNDIDYLENQCAPEPPNCEYSIHKEKFLPYFDRYIPNIARFLDCQRLCDQENEFTCRSLNFQSFGRECSISSEDIITVGGEGALLADQNYLYADKGNCKAVKVECTTASMNVKFSFGRPFEGRVYAQGNPQVCFEIGNREIEQILRIPLDSTCGTKLMRSGKYVNTVVIQQHPIIMQETDKAIRVECSFDAGDQTISFAPQFGPGRVGGGIDINNGIPLTGPGVTDVVSNTAPTPKVVMNIYRNTGTAAGTVELGEILTMRIEMKEKSAFGLFARNLEARTEFGELMTLIDNAGCPRYPNIFPALQVDPASGTLFTMFKAFRFPSTGKINFVATIRFCQGICEPANCGGGIFSYGKRRRRSIENTTLTNVTDSSIYFSIDLPTKLSNASSMKTVPAIVIISSSTTTKPEKITTEGGPNTEIHLERKIIENSNESSNISEISINSPPLLYKALDLEDEDDIAFNNNNIQELIPTDKIYLPSDVPVTLSLIVGEETEVNYGQYRYSFQRSDNNSSYVCSQQSTVITLVSTLLLLLIGTIVSFYAFYNSKKKAWEKALMCEQYSGQSTY